MSNSEMSCCGFIVPWSIISRLIACISLLEAPLRGDKSSEQATEAPAREARYLVVRGAAHCIGSESGFHPSAGALPHILSTRGSSQSLALFGLLGFRVAGQHGTHTLARAELRADVRADGA